VCDLFGSNDERGVGMSWLSHGYASYVFDEVEVFLHETRGEFHLSTM